MKEDILALHSEITILRAENKRLVSEITNHAVSELGKMFDGKLCPTCGQTESGWVCPNCGRVYNPKHPECAPCNGQLP